MPIAYGKDQLFLAWEGTDEHLFVASSTDGNLFTNKHQLAEASLKSTRPAIAFGKGLVFLAWIDHEDHVNILSSPDGVYWSNKRTISETSHRKCPPALVYAQDRLYLAWTGRDRKGHLNITSFTVADDGELAEFAKVTMDEESTEDAGPALTTDGNLLYLVWQGTDDHLNVVESKNGKDFQNKRTLKEKSPHTATPGIAFGDGFFYFAWIGHDDHLNLLTSADGLDWSNKVTLQEKSTGTGVASLTYGNGTLFLEWTGTDHKHHVDVMSFYVEGANGVLPTGKKVVLEEEEQK
jgi:hypothetical protein